VVHLSTDFTDKDSIQTTIQHLKTNYAEFSTLICCAGIGYIEKLDEIDYEHTEKMFGVNVIGQSFLLSGMMNQIKSNSADVVFVGATIGYKGNEFMPMYSVSKRGTR
jgi:short-subunit dehydrogenase